MYKDDEFVFYEKLYYHELESKQKIDLRLQSLIVFTAAWLNAVAYILQTIDLNESTMTLLFFYNLITLYCVFIVRSLYFSISSFYGSVYQYLEKPSVFRNYYNEYYDYCKDNNKSTKEAKNELKLFIMDSITSCTDNNSNLNDLRSKNAFEATRWLVYSFAPFTLAFVIFIVFNLDLKHPTKPILIEVVTQIGEDIDGQPRTP
ncbi:TPA: hypothetical protein ACGUT0_003670 [Vibrio vulnificus]|nr:hypothetical protein [Vibrio vulnificus]